MREHVNYQVLDTTILLVYFIILGMIFVVWLAEYILQGLGMYRLAQAQGWIHPGWHLFRGAELICMERLRVRLQSERKR